MVILSYHCSSPANTGNLVEGVGAGSPVGEEERKTNGLEGAGKGTDGDGVKGTLLSEDLGDDLHSVSRCS